ncbi:MAG: metallophosphatase family protein [Anaerolineales bacterium]|nr:metallophosphatase family protein [Anaerolineales bacterium]
MKVLVISDIHGNRTALEAVLDAAGKVGAVWCLGDIIGYGPDPNDCVSIIRDIPNLVCLRGNHDSAAIGLTEKGKFNFSAQIVLEWTADQLNPVHRQYLQSLSPQAEVDDVTLVHGSPRDPVWEYIMDVYTATANFDYFTTNYCFVGHSHLPVLYYKKEGKDLANVTFVYPGDSTPLPDRSIVNPGSVGQPRDHDPRAAYTIFDTVKKTWTQYRIPYDITDVQARMTEAGLPIEYVQRLDMGW